MEGMIVLIAVAVVSAIAGALISKGCCGSGKANDSCCAPRSSGVDSDKEKAIDELMSKKRT